MIIYKYSLFSIYIMLYCTDKRTCKFHKYLKHEAKNYYDLWKYRLEGVHQSDNDNTKLKKLLR